MSFRQMKSGIVCRLVFPFLFCLVLLAVPVLQQLAVAQEGAGQEPIQVISAPESLAQGDPLLVWICSEVPLFDGKASLVNDDQKTIGRTNFFFMPIDGPGCLYGALVPIPFQTKTGPARLVLEWDQESQPATLHVIKESTVSIEKTDFAREDIALDKANTLLRTQEDPAKTAESLSFAKVFAARDQLALFADDRMIRPLGGEWRQTAGFGDMRRYQYYNGGGDTSVHGGIDLGVKAGSNVLACLPGNVVFAKSRIVTGNTIVLEHLPGLFSIYMHLSKMLVNEGDRVEKGAKIGLSGSTGLSTGPHLHWECRIGDVPVNPYYWLEHPLLDKEFISSKITSLIEGR